MKPINVEITMGHDIGVSSSYYKPTEGEVLEDYLKAVALLTISNDAFISKKQILEMKEEARENEYTIMTKLKEKDVEIKTIRDKFSQMQSQMQSLLSSLSLMNETEKSTFAKQLLEVVYTNKINKTFYYHIEKYRITSHVYFNFW